MPPIQNPQENNQLNGPPGGQPMPGQPYTQPSAQQPYPLAQGQSAGQPQSYEQHQSQAAAAPMMEPFGQKSDAPQQAVQPAQQAPQQPYPAATAQQYNPAQPSGGSAQPLRPYHPEFNKPDPVDQNPYDFFLNEDGSKKAKKFSGVKSGGTGIGMGKILLAVGGMVTVVVVAAAVVISSSKGSDQSPGLTAIATEQQKIIHISTAATPILEAQNLQNFAATAQASTTSAQFQYVEYLDKAGVKIDQKALAATTFQDVDKVLAAAQSASTYDTTFKSVMQTTLAGYLAKLQKSKASSVSQTQSQILDKNIATTTLLQQQLGT